MENPRFASVTSAHVRNAAKMVASGNVRKWGVRVNQQEYAVRPLMIAAANLVQSTAPLVTPMDSNSHQCARWLKKLGFIIKYHESSE
ncbi:MAG TPA: hypothetical protein VEG30_06735 [Terriglobales bacterium]|nr:hypothetical protein [Terriglobales bacterium]